MGGDISGCHSPCELICNTEMICLFQASGCVPMVDSLSDMVLRGQAIQVHLEPLDKLESLMVEVQEWKESAATTFLQKDSTLTLLEVKILHIVLNIHLKYLTRPLATTFLTKFGVNLPTYFVFYKSIENSQQQTTQLSL